MNSNPINPKLHVRINGENLIVPYKESSLNELYVFLSTLESEASSIRNQIAEATAKNTADDDWLDRSRRALSTKRNHIRVLKIWCDAKKSEHRHARTLADAFMDAARDILDDDLFDEIMDEAKYDEATYNG